MRRGGQGEPQRPDLHHGGAVDRAPERGPGGSGPATSASCGRGTPGWSIRIGEAAFNLSQVVAFLVAVLFTAALFAFMSWTHAGRVMRATAQDVEAATLMGIDTDRVYRAHVVDRHGLRRHRGGADAPLYSVYPTAGLQFVLLAYVVVVLGGLGDMSGPCSAA